MSRSTIVLFDVDGTLTASRKEASPEMIEFLKTLRGKVRHAHATSHAIARTCAARLAVESDAAQAPRYARDAQCGFCGHC